MSYCLNPSCKKPYNPDNAQFCQSCRSLLVLKNHYRAVRPLGEGGMGRTFLAVDEDRLNAPCAIKQFLPAPEIQQDAEAMAKATELFEQEARQLLQLGDRHSQIPSLYAYFEQDKRLYLVQQLIEGETLWQQLRRYGRFDETQIRDLLLDLLPVLQFIHDAGVIHRDIKPTNIIRRSDRTPGTSGQWVPIDFGISKQIASGGMAKTGTRTGTEGYAPLEQLRGGRAYPASDLYSLGVTCIQLLCDRPPEELYDPIESRWLWRSHLRRLGTDVSDRLAAILDKMLQESVKARYQSAIAVLEDLNNNAVSRQYTSPIAPFVPRVSPVPVPKPPNPTVLRWQARRWECELTLTGHGGTVSAIAIGSDGKAIASASEDKTIKIWDRHTGEVRHTLTQHSAAVNAIAISPDGKLLMSGSTDKTIKLWQLDTGFLLRTFSGHTAAVNAIALSPDGKLLISGSADKTIKIWEIRTARLRHTLTGHNNSVLCLSVSPDGKAIASGSDDRTIKIWQNNGNLKTTLTGHNEGIKAIAIGSDGQTLASASSDRTIQTWQLETGQWLATPKEHLTGFSAIAYAPNSENNTTHDGHILASGGEDKTIKLWHQETGQLLHTLTGHSDTITALSFTPDSQTIVSASADKTIKIWRGEG